jgi:hypothetical protein
VSLLQAMRVAARHEADWAGWLAELRFRVGRRLGGAPPSIRFKAFARANEAQWQQDVLMGQYTPLSESRWERLQFTAAVRYALRWPKVTALPVHTSRS